MHLAVRIHHIAEKAVSPAPLAPGPAHGEDACCRALGVAMRERRLTRAGEVEQGTEAA